MAPKCQVFGCPNTSSNCPHLGFFSIPDPKKEPDRCKVWLQRLGSTKYSFETYAYSKNRVVCQQHFEPDCIVNALSSRLGFSRRKQLQSGSVPTIFSSEPESDVSRSTEDQQQVADVVLLSPGISPEVPTASGGDGDTIDMETGDKSGGADLQEEVPSASSKRLLFQPVPFYSEQDTPQEVAQVVETMTSPSSPKVLKSPLKRSHRKRLSKYSPRKALFKSPRKEKPKSAVTQACQTDPPDSSDFQQQFPEVDAYAEPTSDHCYTGHEERGPPASVTLMPPTRPPSDETDDDPDSSGSMTSSGSSCDSSQTYLPSSSSSDDDEELLATDEQRWLYQSKYLVFTENLEQLFYRVHCSECGSQTAHFDTFVLGSLLGAKLYCSNGHLALDWKSQPVVKRVGVGNILLASAILFSGNTFARISQFGEFIGLNFISRSTFFSLQRSLLNLVIDRHFQLQQGEIIASLPASGVRLSGDGRCDSPGYSAKYCTYSMMDMATSKIVSSNVVQVTETTSSVAMEKLGFQRSMEELQGKDVAINVVATDRHTGIRSVMKKDFPNIDHQFDVWHLAKSIKKKIIAKAKSKECTDLLPWLQAISNHLWWAAQTCEGDADLLVEKWTSLTYHITNVHEWVVGERFRKCAHPPLTDEQVRSKAWLQQDSAAHTALNEVLFDKRLLTDIKFLTQSCHTGQLEVFHGAMLKYCPKRLHFDMPQMWSRTQLAIIDHNCNTSRKHAVVTSQTKQSAKKGHKRYRLFFSKATKRWTVTPIYEPKSYGFVFTLMEDALSVKSGNLTLEEPQTSRPLPANIAPSEAPRKEDAVKMFQSRFASKE